MEDKSIVFRADGNSRIGLGHVMRCLALCQMLRTDFRCSFAIVDPSATLKQTITDICDDVIELESADDPSFFEAVNKNSIVILDGYEFDITLRKVLKEIAYKVVLIDDLAIDYACTDMVINHCLDPERGRYQTDPPKILLQGFEYSILRQDFLQKAADRSKKIEQNAVFICMGGSDSFNITAKALLACLASGHISDVFIVTGSAYSHETELYRIVEENQTETNIQLYKNISAGKIVELLSRSRIAISSASSIAMEVCCCKVGLIIGITASNQKLLAENLINRNCCISVGEWQDTSTEDIISAIRRMENDYFLSDIISNQQAFFDGLSSARIIKKIKELIDTEI